MALTGSLRLHPVFISCRMDSVVDRSSMDGDPVTLASVPAPRGGRLHISFGLGNELHVMDVNPSTSSDSTASVVQWGAPSAAQRRIAYDSLGMYQQLHQAALEPMSVDSWAQTMQYSKTISSILAADGIRGEEASSEELFALQERAVWDLLALFFVGYGGATGGGAMSSLVSQDLARWLRSNAVAASGGVAASPLPPALSAQLQQASLPESSPAYWPSLQRLVALGWLDDALELLGLHSAWLRYDSTAAATSGSGGGDQAAAAAAVVEALDAVTLLLRRFPLLSQPGVEHSVGRQCASPSDLAAYRRSWQGQCGSLLADAGLWARCGGSDGASAAGLQGVLGVLCGEHSALSSAASTWLELLVAQLLHAYPTAKPQAELAQLLQRCYAAKGAAGAAGLHAAASAEFLQAAAAALEACAALDPQAAMRVCSAFCSDWFMAHAPDLLAAHPAGKGVLGRELPHLGGSQVEFYCLEYAAALMPHPPTWALAAAYLAWCPAHGQAAMQALLRHLPLEAGEAAVARKAAAVARYHGLGRLAEDVHRVQGVLCWQAGMLGAALTWLAGCDDVRRINVALHPLATAVSAGQVAEEQAAALQALQPVLDCLPPGSSNVALLSVHRLLQQGQDAAAAAGAASTGSSGGGGSMHAAVAALAQLPEAMRDSCLQLVCAAVPLMPPGSLSERDCMYLLQWLLSAESRLAAGSSLAASIQVARLALVRCLAASHMAHQQQQQHRALGQGLLV